MGQRCVRCGSENAEGARFCSRCGQPFEGPPSAAAPTAPPVGVLPGNVQHFRTAFTQQEASGNTFVDFLLFRRMIIPVLIRVLFILILIGAVVTALVFLVQGNIGGALGALILVPLVARLYGELLILLFVMNDSLTDIRGMLTELRERSREGL